MANVRIKDLTTTAATTASDDFFGVDGATNGTRKLNAYSPTFGGNLTVSGTGTSSVAGKLTIGAVPTLIGVMSVRPVANGILNIRNAGEISANSGAAIDMLNDASDALTDFTVRAANYNFLNTGPVKVGGNLTVSGTGTSSVAGNLSVGGTVNASGSMFYAQQTGEALSGGQSTYNNLFPAGYVGVLQSYNVPSGTVAGSLLVFSNTNSNGNTQAFIGARSGNTDNGASQIVLGQKTSSTAWTERMTIFTNGNVGINVAGVDGGQKLQVSGSAIFGSTNTAQLSNPTGQIIRQQFSASTVGLRLEADSANAQAVIGTSSNHSLLLRTNDTTALTLDSSQRCILAGALRLNNAYTAGVVVQTGYVTIQDSAGNTYKVLVGT